MLRPAETVKPVPAEQSVLADPVDLFDRNRTRPSEAVTIPEFHETDFLIGTGNQRARDGGGQRDGCSRHHDHVERRNE